MSPRAKLRQWVFRRRARNAIWFLGYMDRVMEVAGYGRREVKNAWSDFIGHPSIRRMILNQLARVNSVKQKKIHREKVEIQLNALKMEMGRLQVRLYHAENRTVELPVEFIEGLILAIDNGESIDGLLGDYGVTIGEAGYDVARVEEAMKDVIDKAISEVKNEVPAVQP